MHFTLNLRQAGFTSKELILVLLSITLLCGLSVPAFHALQNNQRLKSMQQTIQSIDTQIAVYKKTQMHFPDVLDQEPMQQSCTTCFDIVLTKGINNHLWYKVSQNNYLFSGNGNSAQFADYNEPGDYEIQYDSQSGSLDVRPIQ